LDDSEHRYLYEHGDDDWWQAGMRACTLALVPPGTAGRSLDLGSGCGYVVRDLLARGLDARGVDISPIAVGFAERLGLGDRVTLGRADEAIRGEAGLTLVTCLDVLPHREVDEDGTVAAVANALAPGGRFVVRVPAYARLYGAHDRFVHQTRRYGDRDLRGLLARHGLRVRRTTFANAALFPLLLAKRGAEALERRGGHDDLSRSSNQLLPGPVNRAFRRTLLGEARLIARGHRLPWGSSLLALAER
jgi:SAM-dependent methyltransferase